MPSDYSREIPSLRGRSGTGPSSSAFAGFDFAALDDLEEAKKLAEKKKNDGGPSVSVPAWVPVLDAYLKQDAERLRAPRARPQTWRHS